MQILSVETQTPYSFLKQWYHLISTFVRRNFGAIALAAKKNRKGKNPKSRTVHTNIISRL